MLHQAFIVERIARLVLLSDLLKVTEIFFKLGRTSGYLSVRVCTCKMKKVCFEDMVKIMLKIIYLTVYMLACPF